MTKLVGKRVALYASLVALALPVVGGYVWIKNLPPCEYEDTSNCYWDAQNMGNGVGTSFYNIGPEYGISITIYIPDARNAQYSDYNK